MILLLKRKACHGDETIVRLRKQKNKKDIGEELGHVESV
jgi:hypothetical protein